MTILSVLVGAAMPVLIGVRGTPADPAPQWSIRLGSPARGLTLSGDLLIAGMDDGAVAAVRMATGELVWKTNAPEHIHADPVVIDSLVLVSYGGLPVDKAPGGIVALDRRTGRVVWRRALVGSMMAGLTPVGHSVIGASGDGCLSRIEITGDVLWRRCLHLVSAMSKPVVASGLVIMGTVWGQVAAIDAATGTLVWVRSAPPVVHFADATASLDSDRVFIAGLEPVGRREIIARWGPLRGGAAAVRATTTKIPKDVWSFFMRQQLVAFDRRTGAVAWRANVGLGLGVTRNSSGNSSVVDGMVVVGGPFDPSISAFDTKDGRQLWRAKLSGQHRGGVEIYNGTVVVAEENGMVEAFSLRDGLRIGGCVWGSAATPSAPRIIDGSLLYAAADGVLRAIPFDTWLRRVRSRAPGPC